jgi:ferredoxin
MTDPVVRVTVDRRICVGSGNCVAVDPTDFDIVDGKSQPARPETTLTAELTDAVLDCPVRAISVWSTQTGERLRLDDHDGDGRR